MKYTPYPYQAFAEKFVLEHKAAGLFLDMGLGKTAITLSAGEKLLRERRGPTSWQSGTSLRA